MTGGHVAKHNMFAATIDCRGDKHPEETVVGRPDESTGRRKESGSETKVPRNYDISCLSGSIKIDISRPNMGDIVGSNHDTDPFNNIRGNDAWESA